MSEERTTYDGGPAFPRPGQGVVIDDIDFGQEGMKLRDYFAGQALPAVVTGFQAEHGYLPETNAVREGIAMKCYVLADAMLRVRGEGS